MFLAISPISFPKLGIKVDPPVDVKLPGGISFNLYGLVIAIGLILAVIYGLKRRKQFGLRENDILDGVLCIVPVAILCARLYYVAFKWDYFKQHPGDILRIWDGGLAIYGGVIAAAVGIVVLCLVKKIKIGAVLDITSLGFLIGQSIGRWGNFFNREAFGSYCDNIFAMRISSSHLEADASQALRTSLNRHAMEGNYLGQIQVHPTFLYESVWNLVGFIGLHFLSKKRKFDGQIALGYVAWYGLGRTFIEGFRADSLYWGPFRVSQMLAAITCFVAVAILVWNVFRYHDPKKLYANQAAQLLEEEEKAKAKKQRKEKKVDAKAADKETEEIVEVPAETEEAPPEEAASEAEETEE